MKPLRPLTELELREQAALLAEIDAAFAEVTREGGVSWRESCVIDDYGSMEERREARARDEETHWKQLVDDPDWRDNMGVGGWCFLDSIGFRYYIAAAMKRHVARGYGEQRTEFALTVDYEDGRPGKLQAMHYSLLNERQCACIARYIRFMVESAKWLDAEDVVEGGSEGDGWQRALDWYWHRHLPSQ